jgi:hypothetical protein
LQKVVLHENLSKNAQIAPENAVLYPQSLHFGALTIGLMATNHEGKL